jgi:hypothetical protein
MKNFRKNVKDIYPSSWFNGQRYVPIDCGDGWLEIIKDLFDELVPLTKDMPDFRILQIKEKFGGLRIYTGGGNDATEEAIERAEAKCYETCDRCGEKGLRRTDGWISVRCDLHAN